MRGHHQGGSGPGLLQPARVCPHRRDLPAAARLRQRARPPVPSAWARPADRPAAVAGAAGARARPGGGGRVADHVGGGEGELDRLAEDSDCRPGELGEAATTGRARGLPADDQRERPCGHRRDQRGQGGVAGQPALVAAAVRQPRPEPDELRCLVGARAAPTGQPRRRLRPRRAAAGWPG